VTWLMEVIGGVGLEVAACALVMLVTDVVTGTPFWSKGKK